MQVELKGFFYLSGVHSFYFERSDRGVFDQIWECQKYESDVLRGSGGDIDLFWLQLEQIFSIADDIQLFIDRLSILIQNLFLERRALFQLYHRVDFGSLDNAAFVGQVCARRVQIWFKLHSWRLILVLWLGPEDVKAQA